MQRRFPAPISWLHLPSIASTRNRPRFEAPSVIPCDVQFLFCESSTKLRSSLYPRGQSTHRIRPSTNRLPLLVLLLSLNMTLKEIATFYGDLGRGACGIRAVLCSREKNGEERIQHGNDQDVNK